MKTQNKITFKQVGEGKYSMTSEPFKRMEKQLVEVVKGTGKRAKKVMEEQEVEVDDVKITYTFKESSIGCPANLKEEGTELFKQALKAGIETRLHDNYSYLAKGYDTFKRAEAEKALKAFAMQADVNLLDTLELKAQDKKVINTMVCVIAGAKKDGTRHTWDGIDECENLAKDLLQDVHNDRPFNAEKIALFKQEAEKWSTFRLVGTESDIFRTWKIDITTPQVEKIIHNLYGALKWRQDISGNTSVRAYALGTQILLEVMRKTFKFDVSSEVAKRDITKD